MCQGPWSGLYFGMFFGTSEYVFDFYSLDTEIYSSMGPWVILCKSPLSINKYCAYPFLLKEHKPYCRNQVIINLKQKSLLFFFSALTWNWYCISIHRSVNTKQETWEILLTYEPVTEFCSYLFLQSQEYCITLYLSFNSTCFTWRGAD